MINDTEIVQEFQKVFAKAPTLISSAPGRINLIGEHTDYNGGYVLPAAISHEMKIAISLRNDNLINLYSVNFQDKYSLESDKIFVPEKNGWYSYFLAVCDQFLKKGCSIPGMDAVIYGDVPLGAGLSSSAAFEVCVATLLDHLCKLNMTGVEIALTAQAAEHSPYVGVRCGIMDQFASALGKESHALLIDCDTLDYQPIPYDSQQAEIIIINTMKPRELRDSDYNKRRLECEEGLRVLSEADNTEYKALRYVPESSLEAHAAKLSPVVYKRVLHNLSENRRVLDFEQSLKDENFSRAGQLLYASHSSLKENFEVSCFELDSIVHLSENLPGVWGCRMTGGGFGGCAVALVHPEKADEYCSVIFDSYRKVTGLVPVIYRTTPAQGAAVKSL